jgi:polar amino acid transport system substrate-binding protein
MTHRLRPTTLLIVGLATAGLALSACGSDSLDGASTSSSSSSSSTTGSVDPALAAQVPAKIKAAGKIVVGSDASYAPNEFLADDGKTVQGMDVDIFNAVAAKLGLKAEFQNAGFDTIILGVTSGKYDVGVSSFTINDERKKQVNMVSYFNAGTQWAVKKGNPKKVDPANACGLNIGVQKGTVQIDDLTARSKKCTDAGKPPIKQIIDADQSKVTASVVSGKADAMLADSPVGLYAVKQTNGQLEALGEIYDAAPYGFVIPKTENDFATAIATALKEIKEEGTYDSVLKTWGNESGGIGDFAVNP